MTEAEMKEQLQVAQDMIAGLENQRNAHANECVQLAAQVKALQRKVQGLENKQAGACAIDDEIMSPDQANGCAIAAQAPA